MTVDTLVIARAFANKHGAKPRELVVPLLRFAPGEQTEPQWRERLLGAVERLQAAAILDERCRLREPDELARLVGKHSARSWPHLADKILPALALGVAPSDTRTHERLVGRDAWAAAIAARHLGLWLDGLPPTLGALCDAYAWRALGLRGKPKRCPAEVRAVFLQRQLGSVEGPPERQIYLLAAQAVGVVRTDLRVLREALVRMWMAGDRRLVNDFAGQVRELSRSVRDGVFGDRKVFISSVWGQLRAQPGWSTLSLDEFKQRLVSAHRAGDLVLARADLVAAMDPALVAASETRTDGASFHFIVREAS